MQGLETRAVAAETRVAELEANEVASRAAHEQLLTSVAKQKDAEAKHAATEVRDHPRPLGFGSGSIENRQSL